MKTTTYGSPLDAGCGFFSSPAWGAVKVTPQKFSSGDVVFYRSLFGLLVIAAITRIGHKPMATPL